MRYLPHIDGLRAIAVLSVIFFHFDISVFSGGFVGVDIFFVISGFLISSIIYKELISTNDFNFTRFYVRRARRLLPSMMVTVCLTSIFAVLLFPSQQLESFGTEVIAGLLSLSNILFWFQSGYFDTAAENKALLHLWSLSVEEQFYLLWPISLVIAYRFLSPRTFKISVCLLLLLSLCITTVVTNIELKWFPKQSHGLFFLTPFRVYEFLVGAIGIFLINKIPSKQYFHESIFLLGLTGIAYSLFVFDEHTKFPYYTALLPCISTLFIILSTESKLAKTILANRITVYIGLLSYTLYLVHWPSIVIIKHITSETLTSSTITITSAIIIMISVLIYHFIEKPLRTTKNATKNQSIVTLNCLFLIICLLLMLSMITFGITTLKSSGFQNFKNELYTSDFIKAGKSKRNSLIKSSCKLINLKSSNCKLNRPVQVLIFGNSHELDGYNIFHEITKDNDQVNLIRFGSINRCDIKINDVNGIHSKVQYNDCIDRVAKLNDPEVISLIDVIVYSSNKSVSDRKRRAWGLLNYLSEKNPSLKKVILGTYFNTKQECAYIANKHKNSDACKMAKYISYSGIKEQEKSLSKEFDSFYYFNKFDALCNKRDNSLKSCITSANGEPMFYDQHHLSLSFSFYIGKRFTQIYSSELSELGL